MLHTAVHTSVMPSGLQAQSPVASSKPVASSMSLARFLPESKHPSASKGYMALHEKKPLPRGPSLPLCPHLKKARRAVYGRRSSHKGPSLAQQAWSMKVICPSRLHKKMYLERRGVHFDGPIAQRVLRVHVQVSICDLWLNAAAGLQTQSESFSKNHAHVTSRPGVRCSV